MNTDHDFIYVMLGIIQFALIINIIYEANRSKKW